MLTGKLPPSALNRLMKNDWIPQGLDEPWQSLVTAALQMKPENRPKTVKVWWETGLWFEEDQRQQEADRRRREAEERAKTEAEEQRQREAQRQSQEAEAAQQRQREHEHQHRETEERARDAQLQRQVTVLLQHHENKLKLPLSLVILLVLAVGGGLLGFLWGQRLQIFSKAEPTPPATALPSVTNTNNSQVEQGKLIQIKNEISTEVILSKTNIKQGIAPAGSVLLLINTESETSTQSTNPPIKWVNLRVCSLGKPTTSTTSGIPVLNPGDEVRIPLTTFQKWNYSTLGGVTNQCSGQPRQSPPSGSKEVTPQGLTSQSGLKTP